MREAEARPRGSPLGALRHPNFTWYWVSQVTTNIGTWMQQVATGWLVLQLTDSPGLLGLNAVVQAVPILAFALVGGLIADRFDRYRLTVASYVIQIIPDAALAWLVMSENIRVEHVFIYSVVSATINGFSTPARQALVPSLVPKNDLLSAMALNSVTWQGAAVVGPAIAGLILAFWGLPGSFNLNVASDVVSLGAVLLVRLPRAEIAPRTGSGWSEMREGIVYAWRSPYVRILLISIAVVTFLARPYHQFMPSFARDVFAIGPEGLGLMMTAPAIGTIASGVALAMMANASLARIFLVTSAVQAVAIIAFCVTRNVPLALLLLIVIGACGSASVTSNHTLLQQVVDERLRGRVMALFMAASWGAWRLGSLPIGLAADVWGVPLAVGAASVALFVAITPLVRSRSLWDADARARH